MSTREQAEQLHQYLEQDTKGSSLIADIAYPMQSYDRRMKIIEAALRDAVAATWEAAEKKCLDMYELGPVRTVAVHIGWAQSWGSGILDAAVELRAAAAKAREVGDG